LGRFFWSVVLVAVPMLPVLLVLLVLLVPVVALVLVVAVVPIVSDPPVVMVPLGCGTAVTVPAPMCMSVSGSRV
jgi:hypothetical protein